jgi:hypothetical protein
MHRHVRATVAASILLVLGAALLGACSSSSDSTSTGGGGGAAVGANVATSASAKLFDTDFKGVCQGATVTRATPYDKAKPTGHKVLYFAPYKDDLVEGLSDMPADWKLTFDANGDAYAAVDLVACATRTGDTFVKDCKDYTDKDNKPTQNVAKVHTATYKVTVHEATTGKELASKDLAGTDSDCPMFLSFDSDTDTVDYYAPPASADVLALIKPFAQPS